MKDVRGFTLIECLVVMSIIGILMAMIVPSLYGYIVKGQTVVCKANRSNVNKEVRIQLMKDEMVPVASNGDNEERSPELIYMQVMKLLKGYSDICPAGGKIKWSVRWDDGGMPMIQGNCSVHGE